jgi:hypothetical protein
MTTRKVTAYACVREGREGMLAFFNIDFETARRNGKRVWILTGDLWEFGATPLEYTDAQVDALLEGYGIALRRAREHGTDPAAPPTGPIGRPYHPKGTTP